MKTLFDPAVQLMNRLRYPYKFGLIGFGAVVAIGFLVVSLTLAMRTELNTARHERDGLVVYVPALKLLQLSQQHESLMLVTRAGETTLNAQLVSTRGDIDKAIAAVSVALSKDGVDLDLDDRWRSVPSAWQQAQARFTKASTVKDVIESHAQYDAALSDFLGDLSEASKLISDPSPRASYIADVLVRKLPEATDRMASLRSAGGTLLLTRDLSGEWRRIAPQLQEVERGRVALFDSIARAGNANPVMQPQLQALLTQSKADFEQIAEMTDREILKGALAMPAKDYVDTSSVAADRLFAHVTGDMVPVLKSLLDKRIERTAAQFERTMLLALVIVALLAYFSLSMFVVILESVSQLSNGAARIGKGELSARIRYPARDELRTVAEQFNRMAQSFGGVIHQVQSTTAELNRSASALAASAAQVASSSERQSDAASSMAAAVEEMTVGVEEISRHAAAAEEVSAQSGQLSTEGGEVVQRTFAEMERIAEAVTVSARSIEELGNNSAQISSIVKSIREIADQTNLLALNAAIEAARVGESGQGFAVVADAVRKLAERTSGATKEITGMVAAIESGTGRAVGVMRDGVQRVQEGVALTNQAGQSMMRIREESVRVVQSVSEISHALREQTAAGTDIATNVEQIARMAEENRAAVAETAMTAERLEALSRELAGEVSRFKID